MTPNDLWRFGDELDRLCPPRWESHSLSELGLIRLENSGYDATPANVEVFATTGGDGTHFALMPMDQRPVLMIVPMGFSNPYVVVGESLHDFLCLGCRRGYFGLEQLSYSWIDTVSWIKTQDDRVDHPALSKLAERFDLSPHDDPGEHLASLRRRYLKSVERAEDY